MFAGKLASLLLAVFLVSELSLESLGCKVGVIVSKLSTVFKRSYSEPKAVFKGCYRKKPAASYTSKTGSVAAIKEISWLKCHKHCYGPKGNAAKAEEMIGLHENNCWCMQTYDKADQTTDVNCDINCPGDLKQSCGGKEFISVYSARIEKGNR